MMPLAATSMVYKLEIIDDPSYQRLADNDAPRCHIHGRVPEKSVAFEGMNTS
jgi:hypothetical protein